MNRNFASIVVCDFEYEVAPGDLPNPLCMVAHVLNENLQHVRTIRSWRGAFGANGERRVSKARLLMVSKWWIAPRNLLPPVN